MVLHRGALVTEIYFGECDPHSRHTMMSCNKSMIGTLAECLIDDGTLDDGALVVDVLPELSGSACADATVRQVMDMVVGIAFTEDYLDQSSDVWPFLRLLRAEHFRPRLDLASRRGCRSREPCFRPNLATSRC